MTKCLVPVIVLGFCSASLHADISVSQSRVLTGKAAVLSPAEGLPKITIRIKGMKGRTDVETYGETKTAITDLETKQVLLLRPGSRIAQEITPPSVVAGSWPNIDISLKPTARSRMIDGVSCAEHAFTMSLDMESMGNPHVPPEAMKGGVMRMNGVIWIASSTPGAAEWTAFNKAALTSRLLSPITGESELWMEKLFEASATVGIPYLTDMTTRFEGSGPMIDMMKEMGTMRTVLRARVSTAPIAADLFNLPAGYAVDKR
jgi:hypothetical protein